jgi:microcystin degradation protein MlrC
MKLFVGGMSQETNSFAPIPTSLRSFRNSALYLPDELDAAARDAWKPRFEAMSGLGDFLKLARQAGHDVVLGPVASAHPGGLIVRSAYESIRDALLEAVKRAMPLDGVLLMLHGAQMAEGYDDCEGDLLTRLRAIVGPRVAIGVELDLHATISPAMIENATALVACKEYPHTDYTERAAELFDIIARTAVGELKPVTTFVRVPMLFGMHTTRDPGKSLVAYAQSLEGRDGVLSVSLVHGFSLADNGDCSASVIVITDGDPAKGDAVAGDLARRFYALRGSVTSEELSIADCIETARAEAKGPVIIAEPSDNPGGGWASDAMFIIREMLKRGVQNAATALIWDPVAVQLAFDAGVGAVLPMRIGGKVSPLSGDPLDVMAEVIGLKTDARQATIFGKQKSLFGPAAAIRVEGVEIVLGSVRTQTFSPDCFTEVGIDPTQKQILALKSSQHFVAMFGPIASRILYCNGEGGRESVTVARSYRKMKRPVWPFDTFAFDGKNTFMGEAS